MQARSRLYARRLKGDLDLGLEPSRIDPGRDRRLAEILTPGGRLPGRPEQDILEESENPNYRIGTRRVMDDRVFRYCYAKEVLESHSGAFVEPENYWEGNGHMRTCVKGATVLYFDNKDTDEAIGENDLADGWVTGLADDAAHGYLMRIKSNAASAGVAGGDTEAAPLGETCKLTLYRGMAHPIATLNHRSYVYPSMYRNVVNHGTTVAGGDNFNNCRGTVICVPLFYVTAKNWFWGLTWGLFEPPCGNQGVDVGLTDNMRVFGFDGFGQIVYLAPNDAAHLSYQPGGYIMMDGHHATAGGDQLCMLQLQP